MTLSQAEGLLVEVSAALASRREREIRGALQAALAGGAAETVEEALLQSYLFLGYPAALRGLALWRELSGRAPPAASRADWEAWRERGERVCARVYGGQYQNLRTNVRALHPDLETWMLVEGYGKVLGRPGLDLRVRELCVAAMLAVLGTAPQLYSHLRGALNAGASVEQVEAALARALRHAGEEERASAERVWQAVRERWSALGGEGP